MLFFNNQNQITLLSFHYECMRWPNQRLKRENGQTRKFS